MLEQYDLAVARVRLLSNACNAIFRVDTADHSRWVVRVMRPGERSNQEIAAWVGASACSAP